MKKYGELCYGSVGDQYTPVLVSLINVISATAGRSHTFIITSNGTTKLYACGNNQVKKIFFFF